jgi:hypothetical protein
MPVVGVGELAGLGGNSVGGQRSGADRGNEAGDDVVVVHVPVQQETSIKAPWWHRFAW